MAKGTRVTQQEKEKMWELYQKYRCFKTVAKKMRRDPGTVSRHVHEYEAAIQATSYMRNTDPNHDKAPNKNQ